MAFALFEITSITALTSRLQRYSRYTCRCTDSRYVCNAIKLLFFQPEKKKSNDRVLLKRVSV